MPEMIPVGNTISPPNPQQSLSNLSSLIGIRQQQQQLQTGQYLQQSAQAGAQQNQEMMTERQRLQSQIQSGAFGDPNSDDYANKVADWARGNLPLIGNEVAQSALTTQSNKVSLRSSVADLQQKYRTGLGDVVSGFYGQNVPSSRINNAVDEYIRQNPDAMDVGHWSQKLISHVDAVQDPAAKQHMLESVVGELTGKPQVTPGTVDVGGQVQPGVVHAAGGFAPQGAPIQKTLAPQVVQQPITQAPSVIGGGAGTTPQPIGGGGGASQVNPWQPPAGYAAAVGDDNTRYQQISNAAQMSQTGMNLARNVAELANGMDNKGNVQTGKLSGEVSDWLTTIRQHDPKLTDRQLLSKYAAQLQNMALQAFGGDTDMSRGIVVHGMPDPDRMGPDAISDASRYMQGLMGMASARDKVATSYVQSNRGSPAGLRASVDDNFMRNANPDVFAYDQIPKGEERRSWLKKHGYFTGTPASDQLRSQRALMRQYGVVGPD